MPRYDYECGECGSIVEKIHSIPDCDVVHTCDVCYNRLRRLVQKQHLEGSYVFPFNLWNIRYDKSKYPKGIPIHNKSEFRKLLASRGLDSPYLHVGG